MQLSMREPVLAASATGTDRHKLVGRMGPWQLVRLLGETSLSRLYEARPADAPASQTALYVVKTLRKEWWHEATAIDAVRREAWLGGRISHPNVVPVLSAQVQRPPFYLAMPRLTGQTAATLIAGGQGLPVAEALWIVRQMAEGLAAVYDATQMLHGDLKPENVLVGPNGHATLLDWGFAHTADEAVAWHSQRLAVSLAYVAPELFTSAYASSPRSDLYSLGVTLYELLSGRRPFAAEDPAELVAQHRTAKPDCIRMIVPDLPKGVGSLVHSLLAKNPLRRPASYREVASTLVRLEIETFGTRAA